MEPEKDQKAQVFESEEIKESRKKLNAKENCTYCKELRPCIRHHVTWSDIRKRTREEAAKLCIFIE